jgi:hypothetical protein
VCVCVCVCVLARERGKERVCLQLTNARRTVRKTPAFFSSCECVESIESKLGYIIATLIFCIDKQQSCFKLQILFSALFMWPCLNSSRYATRFVSLFCLMHTHRMYMQTAVCTIMSSSSFAGLHELYDVYASDRLCVHSIPTSKINNRAAAFREEST